MAPDHPSQPPGPEAFNGKGMFLTLQVANVTAEFERLKKAGYVQLINATPYTHLPIRRVLSMARRGRPGLSAKQKAELWQRWKNGESLSDIGRALGKHAASVFGVLRTHGGICPRTRRRSRLALTVRDREEISRGLAAGCSMRHIAAAINRPPSTVSREITRNGGRTGYRAAMADEAAWDRARRPKRCRLASHAELRHLVAEKLCLQWSPEQIAGWLRQTFPCDETRRVSHETIYRSLFIQARGVLKRELLKHLRSHRVMRHGKTATTKGQPRGQIIDGVSIRERPASVEDRAVPGHWEGDLLAGARNTHIATLVERQSRFTLLVKVEGKDSDTVVAALTKHVKRLPSELRRSLTWDRGMELAHHKRFTLATNLRVYFCDPQSPWQRGTNENTNRLLRQYFPKGTDLSRYTQTELNAVALRLNQRPRKTLGFQTPAEQLDASVALTG
jgi:IS30 family transposase